MAERRTHRPIARKTMAEKVADDLTEDIVAGKIKAGETIPTEPELAAEFGVSRSVVRDATRMLAARGLVDVRHGRGAFVTSSPMDAFSDALLLALRREGATAWDVEEFFRALWPEMLALAAVNATDDDIASIRSAATRYLDVAERDARDADSHGAPRGDASSARGADDDASPEFYEALAAYLDALLAATHNKVLILLSPSLRSIRSLRSWKDSESGIEDDVAIERESTMSVLKAIEERDPEQARNAASHWSDLPREAVDSMRRTEVGTTVKIPVVLADFFKDRRPT